MGLNSRANVESHGKGDRIHGKEAESHGKMGRIHGKEAESHGKGN
ncbi:hypothetical protein [Halalkalibacillus sediminis]|nr:hypothetical protein [Halalkalibacillus sediminis]